MKSRRDLVVRLAELAAVYGTESVLAELAIAYDRAGSSSLARQFGAEARSRLRAHRESCDELDRMATELEADKRCGCGRTYTPEAFAALPPPASGEVNQDDGIERLELRNCPCGSTIAMGLTIGGVR